MNSSNVDRILQEAEIVMTCGTGGVGKTTLSAALGIRAAELGRRVLVITIDPARRLATSLGIPLEASDPTEVTDNLRNHGWIGSGTLHALMPDTRRTFEEFFRSVSPSEKVAERILSSPIFQVLAREFSGANEYMALKRLAQLRAEKRFDLIVLDTPPSRSALQFFEAPERLNQFFEEKWFRLLALPANRMVAATLNKAVGMLEKLTGSGFVTKLLEFLSALFETEQSFRKSLREITEFLRSPKTRFLFTTTPAPEMTAEAEAFIRAIREKGLRFDGILFNRSHDALLGAASSSDDPELREAMAILRHWRDKEQAALDRFKDRVLAVLPELSRDIHDIKDLIYVAHRFSHDFTDRHGGDNPSSRI